MPTGLKALAQTLPVLKVPNVIDKENDSMEAQYNGGVVNGNDELATVAATPRVPSLIVDVVNMCFQYDNCTVNETDIIEKNCTMNCTGDDDPIHTEKNYWTLLLLLFPVFTVFGNILVLMSVYKERSLQTVTNYFIVSLAVADLLLASFVMPFAVYYLVGPPPVPAVHFFLEDINNGTLQQWAFHSVYSKANNAMIYGYLMDLPCLL